MKKTLSRIPIPLLVICGLFFIVPLWSMTFLGPPSEVVSNHTWGRIALISLAYWIFPLVIATSILRRSFVLLPAFLLECITLVLHTAFNESHLPPGLEWARFSVIAVMAGLGIIIINKDILYPFITGYGRLWRKVSRHYTNDQVLTLTDSTGTQHPVQLEDCSLVGIGVSTKDEKTRSLLSVTGKGGTLVFELAPNKCVVAELVWTRETDGVRYAGFYVQDSSVMETYLCQLPAPKGGSNFLHWINKHWASSAFRRVVVMLWVMSAVATVGIPSCGGKSQSSAQSDTLPGTGLDNSVVAACPVADGFLCENIPGVGSSPANFCTLPRLSAITAIPEQCPAGSCLLIATMGDPDPLIAVASCWDMAANAFTKVE